MFEDTHPRGWWQKASPEERFWARLDTSQPGCWEWQGGRTCQNGYGMLSINGKRRGAHRFALELTLGRELRPGEIACHHCDNPPCARPDHIYLGSPATNLADSARRSGRVNQNVHKTHCIKGHPLSGDNLYIDPGRGNRVCRTCARKRAREWYRRTGRPNRAKRNPASGG